MHYRKIATFIGIVFAIPVLVSAVTFISDQRVSSPNLNATYSNATTFYEGGIDIGNLYLDESGDTVASGSTFDWAGSTMGNVSEFNTIKYVDAGNTSDIQATINECPNKCKVVIPAGDYRADTVIQVNSSTIDSIWIAGSGAENTKIPPLHLNPDETARKRSWKVSDVMIQPATDGYDTNCFEAHKISRLYLDQVQTEDCGGYGMEFDYIWGAVITHTNIRDCNGLVYIHDNSNQIMFIHPYLFYTDYYDSATEPIVKIRGGAEGKSDISKFIGGQYEIRNASITEPIFDIGGGTNHQITQASYLKAVNSSEIILIHNVTSAPATTYISNVRLTGIGQTDYGIRINETLGWTRVSNMRSAAMESSDIQVDSTNKLIIDPKSGLFSGGITGDLTNVVSGQAEADLNMSSENIDNFGDLTAGNSPSLIKSSAGVTLMELYDWHIDFAEDITIKGTLDMYNHNITDVRFIGGGGDAIQVNDSLDLGSNAINTVKAIWGTSGSWSTIRTNGQRWQVYDGANTLMTWYDGGPVEVNDVNLNMNNNSVKTASILQLEPSTLPACDSTTEGQIRYNGTHHVGCDGTAWHAMY